MTRSFHISGRVTLKWLGLSFRKNYGITTISKHRVSINQASIPVLTNGKNFVSPLKSEIADFPICVTSGQLTWHKGRVISHKIRSHIEVLVGDTIDRHRQRVLTLRQIASLQPSGVHTSQIEGSLSKVLDDVVWRRVVCGIAKYVGKLNRELLDVGVGLEMPVVDFGIIACEVAVHIFEWCIVGAVALSPGLCTDGAGVGFISVGEED